MFLPGSSGSKDLDGLHSRARKTRHLTKAGLASRAPRNGREEGGGDLWHFHWKLLMARGGNTLRIDTSSGFRSDTLHATDDSQPGTARSTTICTLRTWSAAEYATSYAQPA